MSTYFAWQRKVFQAVSEKAEACFAEMPVHIACGYTELRWGIDGLAGIVQIQFKMDPFQRVTLLFCSRKRDRLQALY